MIGLACVEAVEAHLVAGMIGDRLDQPSQALLDEAWSRECP